MTLQKWGRRGALRRKFIFLKHSNNTGLTWEGQDHLVSRGSTRLAQQNTNLKTKGVYYSFNFHGFCREALARHRRRELLHAPNLAAVEKGVV